MQRGRVAGAQIRLVEVLRRNQPQRPTASPPEHGRDEEHPAGAEMAADEAHQHRGHHAAQRLEADIMAEPLAEPLLVRQRQRDGGDRRCQQRRRQSLQRLGAEHRPTRRQQRQHQSRHCDAERGSRGDGASPMQRIHQHAGGDLPDHGGDGADGERDADIRLVPAMGGEIHGHERAEPRSACPR